MCDNGCSLINAGEFFMLTMGGEKVVVRPLSVGGAPQLGRREGLKEGV